MTENTTSQFYEKSGVDIRVAWNAITIYIVAYTVDRTQQVLLSIKPYTEESWHMLLTTAGERFDELFNPGPAWADKTMPGKAVEIYLLLPWDNITKKTLKEFYQMINSRVLFRIKNQAHIPTGTTLLVFGSDFYIKGAPDPDISVGANRLYMSNVPFYEWSP